MYNYQKIIFTILFLMKSQKTWLNLLLISLHDYVLVFNVVSWKSKLTSAKGLPLCVRWEAQLCLYLFVELHAKPQLPRPHSIHTHTHQSCKLGPVTALSPVGPHLTFCPIKAFYDRFWNMFLWNNETKQYKQLLPTISCCIISSSS